MIQQIQSRVPLFSFISRLPGALLIALASFYLYLFTLAPDLLDSDGGEFQFAAWNFSFVHPTGYPLFLILGGVFQHLFPIGNPAFRLNVFNAIIAALAVSVLYLAAKEITSSRAAAAIAAASFALSRTFWFYASGAEVYALNAFFLSLLLFLAVKWHSSSGKARKSIDIASQLAYPPKEQEDLVPLPQRETLVPEAERSGRVGVRLLYATWHKLGSPSSRTFAFFCLTYGFALAHHRTIALWIPAFALFFVIALKRSQGFTFHISRPYFLIFTFAFLLPLLLYLYIPLRAPASPYFQLPITNNSSIVLYDNSPQGLLDYLFGRTFQQELGWDSVSLARLSSTPRLLLDEFGLLGCLVGVGGLVALVWRRDWALLALTGTGLVTTILFNAVYHIGDIAGFYLPVFLIWAVWIGVGLKEITNYQLLVANYKLLIVALALVAIPAFQLFSNFASADRSSETKPRATWMSILSAPLPQNAILISNDRDEMMPLWYIQYVERTRTDLLGLFPLITPAPQYANVGKLTDSVLDSRRPILFIKPMPGLEIKFRLEPATPPLVRVLGRAAENAPQVTANALIANSVRVVGYDALRESGQLRIAVYFQAQSKLARNYTTFVNLLSVHGGKVAQSDDHQVGGDYYPTTLWQVGETLRDEHVIPLSDVLPGTYRVFTGMYRQPDFEPFGDPVEIGVIELP